MIPAAARVWRHNLTARLRLGTPRTLHTGFQRAPNSALRNNNKLIIQPKPALRSVFHTTPRRPDVFFVAFPALKAHLLSATRISLVLLPFMYRYK